MIDFTSGEAEYIGDRIAFYHGIKDGKDMEGKYDIQEYRKRLKFELVESGEFSFFIGFLKEINEYFEGREVKTRILADSKHQPFHFNP